MAFVARVGCVLWLQQRLDATGQQFLISGDAEGYWELGQKILHGEDYAIHSPPRYVHRMPGFPLLLAGIMSVVGESFLAVRLVLAGIATFGVWLVSLLGCRLGSERIGLLAAALAAVSPTFIGFSGIILSETVFSVALLLAALMCEALVVQLQRPSVSSLSLIAVSLATGLAFALGVYLKPSWILAAPLFCALLVLVLRPFWKSLLAGSVLMLGLVLALLPWGMRSQQVSGHFTLTTFWMGPSLYDGVQPGATGESDMRFFDDDALTNTLSEYGVDQEYRRRSMELILENPGRIARLASSKFVRYWNLWPNADQFQNRWLRISLTLFYLPVFTVTVIGIWHCRSQFWSLAICLGPVLYFSLIHLIFVSSLRYRLPGEYPMLVMTAFGLEAILLWARRASVETTMNMESKAE